LASAAAQSASAANEASGTLGGRLEALVSTFILVVRKFLVFDIESIYVLKLFAIMCEKDTIVRHGNCGNEEIIWPH